MTFRRVFNSCAQRIYNSLGRMKAPINEEEVPA